MTLTSGAFNAFRIFDYVDKYAKTDEELAFGCEYSMQAQEAQAERESASVFAQLGADSAQDEKYKSGMTKMLEDFTEKFGGLFKNNSSAITAKGSKRGFWGKVKAFFGKENDNIFETKEGQKKLEEVEYLSQADLYKSEIALNNGIKYAKDDESLIQSALAFAQADIAAIEKSYNYAYHHNDENGKLDGGEIGSCNDGFSFMDKEHIDLDGKERSTTAKEYASFILAADKNQDGLISLEEAQKVRDDWMNTIQKDAQKIYDENFGKK